MTSHPRRPAARALAAAAIAVLLVPAAWVAGPPSPVGAVALIAVPAPTATASGIPIRPAPVPAALASTTSPTATSIERSLLTWLNRDRVALGLRPLRADTPVARLAGERAARLAGIGILSHQYAGGDLGSALSGRGVEWYRYGENIGTSTATWGLQAASMIYALWRASPEHWTAMTSETLNYVGIGVAYRSENGATYASIVFTESPDHTAPWARLTSARTLTSTTGTAASFAWRGADPVLQSHTAGLRTFDVQYRVDAGPWRIVRSGTTTTVLTLPRRPPGHAYWLRVRARDGRGNLSAWSRPLRVIVR